MKLTLHNHNTAHRRARQLPSPFNMCQKKISLSLSLSLYIYIYINIYIYIYTRIIGPRMHAASILVGGASTTKPPKTAVAEEQALHVGSCGPNVCAMRLCTDLDGLGGTGRYTEEATGRERLIRTNPAGIHMSPPPKKKTESNQKSPRGSRREPKRKPNVRQKRPERPQDSEDRNVFLRRLVLRTGVPEFLEVHCFEVSDVLICAQESQNSGKCIF